MVDPTGPSEYSNALHREFVSKHRQFVIDNPKCQRCHRGESVEISRWGQIQACCRECLDAEMREFQEGLAADLKAREEEGW